MILANVKWKVMKKTIKRHFLWIFFHYKIKDIIFHYYELKNTKNNHFFK